jgi:HNH endonuclease
MEIKLTQGKVALIDDEDYDRISRYNWMASNEHGVWYAVAKIKKNGIWTNLKMHRFLMSAKEDEIVDHRDHDGLNNQKANLRRCTQSQNLSNQRKTRGISKYKGLYFRKECNLWYAGAKSGNIRLRRGGFSSEEAAALAYNEIARELHGEFACLNEVPWCSILET